MSTTLVAALTMSALCPCRPDIRFYMRSTPERGFLNGSGTNGTNFTDAGIKLRNTNEEQFDDTESEV